MFWLVLISSILIFSLFFTNPDKSGTTPKTPIEPSMLCFDEIKVSAGIPI